MQFSRGNKKVCQSKHIFTIPADLKHCAKFLLKELAILSIGLIIISIFTFIYFINIPIFLFRLILIKLAPILKPDYGKILSAQGNIFSSDLFSGKAPRCTIVVSHILEGQYSKEDAYSIFTSMVESKDSKTGRKLYPEFKQYLEKWFDFPFWKNDPHFDIKNHIHFYTFGDPKGEVKNEEDISGLTERLINQQFNRKRSPWEFHVVQNYESSEFPFEEKCTLLLFRAHHTLADGFGIIFALVEGICKLPLESIKLPKANLVKRGKLEAILYSLSIPFRAFYDISHFYGKKFRNNPWNVPDSKKSWKQYYGRGKAYPIEKIKEIKNGLNVSFTSVLLSAISASMARALNSRQQMTNKRQRLIERAAFFIPLPLPGSHPNALENHVTGAQIDLPVANSMDPVDRVFDCENMINQQKKSTIPMGLWLIARTMGLQPSSICGMLTYNQVNVSGLTSFPAGSKQISVLNTGKKLLSSELAVGALTGISAVGFMAISYVDKMRFGLTAEAAVVKRHEVQELLDSVIDELELLHEIVTAKKKQIHQSG